MKLVVLYVDSLIPPEVPDRGGTKPVLADPREVVRGPGACPDTQTSDWKEGKGVSASRKTRRPVSASGWLMFDRYGKLRHAQRVCVCECVNE